MVGTPTTSAEERLSILTLLASEIRFTDVTDDKHGKRRKAALIRVQLHDDGTARVAASSSSRSYDFPDYQSMLKGLAIVLADVQLSR